MSANVLPNQPLAASRTLRPVSSTMFDAMAIALAAWIVIGVFIDGFAHSQGVVESFFTPWHAVLYSGFAVNGVFFLWVVNRNITRGYRFINAIPSGYETAVAGVLIFGLGGGLDLLWHTIFGIEESFEALVSPSHLILALGMFLIAISPFNATRKRGILGTRFSVYLPMLLSVTLALCIVTFFTMSLHPFFNVFAARALTDSFNSEYQELLLISGFTPFLFQAAVLTGFLLLPLLRWRLPFGSITLIVTLNIVALSSITLQLPMMIVGLLAGLLLDLFVWRFNPSRENVVALRVFTFLVPTVLYTLYFALLGVFNYAGGIGWTVHVWTGAIVMSGAVGVLLSYLVVPVTAKTQALPDQPLP